MPTGRGDRPHCRDDGYDDPGTIWIIAQPLCHGVEDGHGDEKEGKGVHDASPMMYMTSMAQRIINPQRKVWTHCRLVSLSQRGNVRITAPATRRKIMQDMDGVYDRIDEPFR